MAKKNKNYYRRGGNMPWVMVDDKFALFMTENRIIIVNANLLYGYTCGDCNLKEIKPDQYITAITAIEKSVVSNASKKFDIESVIDLNDVGYSHDGTPLGSYVLTRISSELYRKAAKIGSTEAIPSDVKIQIFKFCSYIWDYYHAVFYFCPTHMGN